MTTDEFANLPASEGLAFISDPEGNGYSVAYIGTCTDSVVVIPSEYKGSPVTSIGDSAFKDCSSITGVVIPDSVTSIGEGAFYECGSLASVAIGNSVTSIGEGAFYSCDNLTSVHINDIAAWCGISFGSRSANPLCHAHNLYVNGELLTNLVIPDGVTSIGQYCFYECQSIKEVTIPGSVTSIGGSCFGGGTSIESVYISDIAAWCNIDFGEYSPLYGANLYVQNELITELVIPEGVASIKRYAFSGCKSIVTVKIPNSVKEIGEFAFYRCSRLNKAYFANTNGWKYVLWGSYRDADISDPSVAAERMVNGNSLVKE